MPVHQCGRASFVNGDVDEVDLAARKWKRRLRRKMLSVKVEGVVSTVVFKR